MAVGVVSFCFSPEKQGSLRSKAPLELGTKCTVFMTSRVRHAQKIGAPVADIAAGIAYSVVQNALYRVIGRDKSAEMGDVVVVQGGTFKSDAVLRAFEKVAGVMAVRPDTAHLMGAIGAALIARDRAHELRLAGGQDAAEPKSATLSAAQLEALELRYGSMQCPGCANACTLSTVSFGDGRSFVSGNRCARGPALAREQLEQEAAREQEKLAGNAGSGRAAQLAAAHERLRKQAAAKAALPLIAGDLGGAVPHAKFITSARDGHRVRTFKSSHPEEWTCTAGRSGQLTQFNTPERPHCSTFHTFVPELCD